MKKLKIYFSILLLFASACSDDFLDRQSLNDLSSDTFWTTEDDAKMALMGCYSALQDQWLFDSDPWSGGVTRLDYLTDNGYTAWQWMAGGDVAQGTHNASSWIIGDTWKSAYRAIGRTNQVIAHVPEIGFNETSAKRIVAEAKVIRATVYNLLAMTYHDVPLITTPQTVQEASVPKNTHDEIMNFITADIEAVVNDLPLPSEVAGNEYGRITRGAGLAMLARIYLYHKDYAKAAETAKKVMDLGFYSLVSDYATLFTTENEKNNEVIFSVAFDRVLDDGSAFAGYWGMIDYQRVLPNLADAFYYTDGLPLDESPLYDAGNPSANRDSRFRTTLVSNGDSWKGSTVTGQEGFYYQRKYTEENNDQDHFDSPQDFYVIRYADVLLMRAEALVQAGGYNEGEVMDLINQVRARAGMPAVEDVEGTGLTAGELLNIIKHERRVELAFEGLHYFDLIRWEELDDCYEWYMENEFPAIQALMYPDALPREFVSPRWPLPQGELDVNKALVQHEEW
jgi:starch-binding outer membrane protein, SusD/RagB family